jgi:hypothetical protein
MIRPPTPPFIWSREHEYRLIKELWAFRNGRVAVRFATSVCEIPWSEAKPTILSLSTAKIETRSCGRLAAARSA